LTSVVGYAIFSSSKTPKEQIMKRYYVSASAFGIIKSNFKTPYKAMKFAREWEKEMGFGFGVATVHGYWV